MLRLVQRSAKGFLMTDNGKVGWEAVLVKLCFNPRKEQRIKDKENESSLRCIPVEPPVVDLLFI